MSDCTKISYKTRREAWEASYRFFEKYGTVAGAYKCHYGRHYHLSRQVNTLPPWYQKKVGGGKRARIRIADPLVISFVASWIIGAVLGYAFAAAIQ